MRVVVVVVAVEAIVVIAVEAAVVVVAVEVVVVAAVAVVHSLMVKRNQATLTKRFSFLSICSHTLNILRFLSQSVTKQQKGTVFYMIYKY